MEWSLVVIRSTDPQPRRFPFELGRVWVAGRYENPAQAADRAVGEGSTNPFHRDKQYYLPLEPNTSINRWQCYFSHESDGGWLLDLASRSGTYLNGVLTTKKCPLHLDDEIRVVDCRIYVSATATIDPAWLAWKNGAVVELAAKIRETRDFARLHVLGDTLRDAGCTDVDILNHCLDQHPDTHRCWVLDLLLEA